MKLPFQLWKRGNYYYYRLQDDKIFHSTGLSNKRRAIDFIYEKLEKGNKSDLTFKEYAVDFYIWKKCPHVTRLREEGKSIGQTWVTKSRSWLESYVFTDPMVNKSLGKITRDDLLKYRSRLLETLSGKLNTANKVMSVVKTIFKEAFFRQDITYDPTQGIGNIKEYRAEPGTFTIDELTRIFPIQSLGPWKDKWDYTCFFLSFSTGMRRGEILGLKWKYVDLDNQAILIEEAWKGKKEYGKPKWNKERVTPMPDRLSDLLEEIRDLSIRIAPNDFVFCYDDGKMLGATWWLKRFDRALINAEIDKKSRNLVPHSFRHTLNTLLRDSGHDPAKIRASLGWSQERIQESYTHWKVDHLRDQAQFIDGLFTK